MCNAFWVSCAIICAWWLQSRWQREKRRETGRFSSAKALPWKHVHVWAFLYVCTVQRFHFCCILVWDWHWGMSTTGQKQQIDRQTDRLNQVLGTNPKHTQWWRRSIIGTTLWKSLSGPATAQQPILSGQRCDGGPHRPLQNFWGPSGKNDSKSRCSNLVVSFPRKLQAVTTDKAAFLFFCFN